MKTLGKGFGLGYGLSKELGTTVRQPDFHFKENMTS